MATPDVFALHTKGGIDPQDLIVAPLFSLAAVALGTTLKMSYAILIVVVALVAS